MDNIYVSRMNDNMTNEYDNMTMTISHDIMSYSDSVSCDKLSYIGLNLPVEN